MNIFKLTSEWSSISDNKGIFPVATPSIIRNLKNGDKVRTIIDLHSVKRNKKVIVEVSNENGLNSYEMDIGKFLNIFGYTIIIK